MELCCLDLNQNFNWSISLQANSKVEMRISNENSVSNFVFENETLQICGFYTQFNNMPIEIYARDLSLNVNGIVSFGSFNHKFPFWINQTGIRVIPYSDGGSITLVGKVEFPVYAIGEGTIFIKGLKLYGNSSFSQTAPPVQNVNWENMLMSPILFIWAVVSFVCVICLNSNWKRSDAIEKIE